MGRYQMRFRDFNGEASTVSVPCSDVTVANYEAEIAQLGAMRSDIEAISLGLVVGHSWTAFDAVVAVGSASSPQAQRESKALVRYYDSVTFERGTLEIPCPDLTKQMDDQPGYFVKRDPTGSLMSTVHADWVALVATLSAFLLPPGGNTAIIEDVIHVGRSL